MTGPVNQRLLRAIQREDPELLEECLQQNKGYGHDDLGKALREAADQGNIDCMRILLKHSALPNIHDANGFTPLIIAAKRGHTASVRLLLAAKCNINKTTFRVRASALHWAATNGHLDCVLELLAAGSHVDAQTSQGRSSLMLAARSDQEDIVEELLEAGADVNKKDAMDTTSLHLASDEGNLHCVKVLLKAGAKVDVTTMSGDTPLLLASKGGHSSVVKELLRHPDNDTNCSSHGMNILHWAAQGGHYQCLELVIHCSIDLNQATTESYFGAQFAVNAGVTPLMLACKGGYSDAAEILLDHGADTEIQDVEGMTALLHAICHDHEQCVTALLQYRADPDKVSLPMDDEDSDWPEDPDADDPDRIPSDHELDEFRISPLFLAIRRNSSASFLALIRGNCSIGGFSVSRRGEYLGPLETALCLGRYHMCDILLRLGHPIQLSMTSTVHRALGLLLQREEHHFHELLEQLSSPPSLLHQCRRSIKDSLDKNILKSIKKLPLPEQLRQFVNMSDLEIFVSKK